VKASKRLDLEKDTTILDLRLVCLEIDAGGQSEDLARAIVELRIVLGALNGVVHHKAVAQVNRFMCAEAIGREEFVARAAVDGKGVPPWPNRITSSVLTSPIEQASTHCAICTTPENSDIEN
jgi:hypothetical protein